MFTLLRIQLRKILPYKVFWAMVALLVGMLATASYIIFKIVDDNLEMAQTVGTVMGAKISVFDFPAVWPNMAWLAGYAQMVLAFFIIIDISNEYRYRTLRQNVIDGLSKADFLISKIWLILVISFAMTLVLAGYSLFMGLNYSEIPEGTNIWKGVDFELAFFVQCFGYLSLAMLLILLVKRTMLAMIILVAYSIAEFTLYMRFREEAWVDFLPLKMLNNPIPPSFMRYKGLGNGEAFEIAEKVVWSELALGVGLCVVLLGLCYWLLRRRDI